MGRDNQPKNRQRLFLERKEGRRKPYDRLLIVCEGKKTEPNYFKEICRFHRLSSANVCVVASKYGTESLQVVDYAHNYCCEHNKWEKVFCVFDEDDHPNFSEAISRANEKCRKLKNDQGEEIEFYAIPSSPCFELWLLLHFEELTTEISGRDLLKRLKKHMPKYEKSNGEHFANTKARLATAYKNVVRLSGNRSGDKIRNPFTAIGEVVTALMQLAKQSEESIPHIA